jgi:hypothetical protein
MKENNKNKWNEEKKNEMSLWQRLDTGIFKHAPTHFLLLDSEEDRKSWTTSLYIYYYSIELPTLLTLEEKKVDSQRQSFELSFVSQTRKTNKRRNWQTKNFFHISVIWIHKGSDFLVSFLHIVLRNLLTFLNTTTKWVFFYTGEMDNKTLAR